MTNRVEQWTGDHDHLQRLDQAVANHAGNRKVKGWVLLDGLEPSGLVWVHLRPYLSQPGFPPGLRVEPDPADPLETLSALEAASRYWLVVLRHPQTPLRPQVQQALDSATRRQLLWMTVEVGDDPAAARVIGEEGQRLSLPEAIGRRMEPVRLGFDENGGREEWVTFPCELTVSSPAERATLSFRLLAPPSSFTRHEYDLVLEDPMGEPLGRGCLGLDLRLRPGQPDEIRLRRSSGFGREPRIRPWLPPPVRPIFVRRPLHLHLVYDRTTLDVDSWPLALVAMEDGKIPEPPQESPVTAGATSAARPTAAGAWNRQLRERLAKAFASCHEKLHGQVILHLWWFADVPRAWDGIARSLAFEPLPSAWNRVGECPIGSLAEALLQPTFDYSPGLDLFDAVDEVLEEVTRLVKLGVEQRDEQHAVLIVGDSPPPPADPADPLWKTLVERPPTTSARCSPKFREALGSLRDLGARVGWLFVRDIRAPREPRPGDASLYAAFQGLRERSLEALRAVEDLGLVVESCHGPEDLERSLSGLFSRMARGEAAIPALRLHAVGGGAVR